VFLFLQMLTALVVIVLAAELFTNALEHLGERLRLSEGVTGSVFAAVGTAMPESIVPLLALLAGTADPRVNEEIGVGAILGAPLMLSTVALCLMAVAAWRKRGTTGVMKPERSGLHRDLNFFVIAFGVAALALFVPHTHAPARAVFAIVMVGTYFIYLLLTLRASAGLVANGHGTESHHALFFTRLRLPDNYAVIFVQLAVGLVLLVGGAKGFIHSVDSVARMLGVSALLLSLLIIPIATELPEKVNSIIWIRRRKDTLAFGNITGAMVFQGTLLPAIGMVLTTWTPRREIVIGIIVTLIASVWLRYLSYHREIRVWHLGINGVLYVTYLLLVLA